MGPIKVNIIMKASSHIIMTLQFPGSCFFAHDFVSYAIITETIPVTNAINASKLWMNLLNIGFKYLFNSIEYNAEHPEIIDKIRNMKEIRPGERCEKRK